MEKDVRWVRSVRGARGGGGEWKGLDMEKEKKEG